MNYTRYEGGTKILDAVQVGDIVRQTAYGKGMGRLEDCGRTGTVLAVNRTLVRVRFSDQRSARPVSPDVLRLLGRASAAEEVSA